MLVTFPSCFCQPFFLYVFLPSLPSALCGLFVISKSLKKCPNLSLGKFQESQGHQRAKSWRLARGRVCLEGLTRLSILLMLKSNGFMWLLILDVTVTISSFRLFRTMYNHIFCLKSFILWELHSCTYPHSILHLLHGPLPLLLSLSPSFMFPFLSFFSPFLPFFLSVFIYYSIIYLVFGDFFFLRQDLFV